MSKIDKIKEELSVLKEEFISFLATLTGTSNDSKSGILGFFY